MLWGGVKNKSTFFKPTRCNPKQNARQFHVWGLEILVLAEDKREALQAVFPLIQTKKHRRFDVDGASCQELQVLQLPTPLLSQRLGACEATFPPNPPPPRRDPRKQRHGVPCGFPLNPPKQGRSFKKEREREHFDGFLFLVADWASDILHGVTSALGKASLKRSLFCSGGVMCKGEDREPGGFKSNPCYAFG